MRKHVLTAALTCAAVLAAGRLLAADGVTDAEIKVGMVNPQQGPASGLGLGMRSGAEAVFKEINSKGGIHGRKINLLVADDGYEPDRTIDATVAMIEQHKVFSLFGYVGTPTSNAVIPIVKEMKVPLVGLFTGAMTLRQPVVPEIVNVRAGYDDEAEMLVERFVKDRGAKKFAVFYQDDGFGFAVLSGTEKALKKRGMAVVAKGTFLRNTITVKAGLAAVMAANPDVVIMVGPYTPIAIFAKEARSAGLKAELATVSFVGTDNLVGAVGKDGNGMVISQVVPFPQNSAIPVVKACGDAISRHAPGEKLGFVNLEGCITAKAFAAGIEKAGKGLTREGLIAAFEGMKQVDLGGVSISMGPDNHQAFSAVYLTQIRDGRITEIEKIDR